MKLSKIGKKFIKKVVKPAGKALVPLAGSVASAVIVKSIIK